MTETRTGRPTTPAQVRVDPHRWPDVAAVPSSGFRAAVADRLFEDVARRLEVRVELPGGRTTGAGGPGAPVMVLRRPHDFARRVGASGLIGFGESYMAGDWDAPDLARVLTVFAAQMSSLVPARLQAFRRLAVTALPSAHTGSQANTRRNISAHYDLSNAMFEQFLDPSMTYSSALFDPREDPADDAGALAAGQARKIERLLDVAGVVRGSTVLEIGTGWGELALRAARRGARVRTVTLSVEQAALARERIAAAGLQDLVEVEVCDYRDTRGHYDAVVSVEMVEAVGHAYWGDYFRTLSERTAPHGRAVLQAITMPHDRMLATRDTFTWIQKYIFPGGFLPSTESITADARRAGLVVHERLAFGGHYARTLRIWRERFEQNVPGVAAAGFDEVFRRMWSLYLAYSEAGFASGYLDVQQVVLTHPTHATGRTAAGEDR
jgi:cyclopropane-fatty-acyl-phospholipid synthase